jgi:iron complex outermembrane receptor protein
LGGYVKVITKTPEVRGLALSSNVSTGSYGYYNPSATAQAGSEALHALIGYSYRTSEFYRDGNGDKVSDLGSYRNGAQNLQAFRTQSAWTKLAFQPSSNQRGEVSYTRQQSGDLLYPYMNMDGIFDNSDRFSVHYNYVQAHGWVHALHGIAYLDKINHLMDNRLRSSACTLPVSMSAQVVSFTNGVRLDADLAQGMTAGYEFYRRYWNSNGSMIMNMMGKPTTTHSQTLPGVTEDVHGVYIAYRRAIGKRLLFTTGARYDHSYTDASKANAALYEAYHGTSATTADDSGLSGNAKLSWQATGTLSLFTGIGSNIRFPDPQERFFHNDSEMGSGWVGNPLLTHPRNTEYDLGATAKNRRYTLSPLFFFSDLDNYITLYVANRLQAVSGVSSTKAQSYANVQAHRSPGI